MYVYVYAWNCDTIVTEISTNINRLHENFIYTPLNDTYLYKTINNKLRGDYNFYLPIPDIYQNEVTVSWHLIYSDMT